MHPLLTYSWNFLQTHWPTIVAYVAAGGGVSILTQIVKKAKQWESDSVIQRFVLLISFIGTSADWYLQNYSTHFAHATNPLTWWPAVTACLFTLATFLHKYPVKQLSGFVENVLKPYIGAVKSLKEAKTVATPEQAVESPEQFQ